MTYHGLEDDYGEHGNDDQGLQGSVDKFKGEDGIAIHQEDAIKMPFDPLKMPLGPLTRARAKRFKDALMGLVRTHLDEMKTIQVQLKSFDDDLSKKTPIYYKCSIAGLIEDLGPTNEESLLCEGTMGDKVNQANDLATLYQKLKQSMDKLEKSFDTLADEIHLTKESFTSSSSSWETPYKQDERILFKEKECVKKEFVSPKIESKDSSSSSSKTHIKLLSEEKGDSNGDGDDESDDDGAAIDDGDELASLSLVASRTLSAYVKEDVQRENLFHIRMYGEGMMRPRLIMEGMKRQGLIMDLKMALESMERMIKGYKEAWTSLKERMESQFTKKMPFDPLKMPLGPLTRARAKRFKDALMGLVRTHLDDMKTIQVQLKSFDDDLSKKTPIYYKFITLLAIDSRWPD
ncbi:hypothetical protein CCACVL1_07338 [Corchorus capsularis]|uniref:Uncharacterized protein n=1 Tax=Corchorus capsularis TaxID=210143 RepID=A0A1R3J6U1_COCAP|nr:hypothetical protein CCACVL1_07338 [Corchorus capsularis]